MTMSILTRGNNTFQTSSDSAAVLLGIINRAGGARFTDLFYSMPK